MDIQDIIAKCSECQKQYCNLDKQTNNCVKSLFNTLQSTINPINSFISKNNTTISNCSKQIPSSVQDMMKHIPTNILSTIYTNSTFYCTKTYIFNKSSISVYLIFQSNKPAKSNIESYFKQIGYLLLFMDRLSNHNNYKNIRNNFTSNIYIYFTPFKKELPNKPNQILDRVHINTGLTGPVSNHSNDILIFREEEWFKVLIHECLHMFNFDFSSTSYNNIHFLNNKLKQLFGIQVDILAFESYTEYWAIVINSMMIALNASAKITYKSFLTKFMKNMNVEKAFSLFQCSKVLHYNHLNYNYFITHNHYNQSHNQSHNQSNYFNYKENTNVFAYYVIKCILLNDWGKFMKWCSIHNNPNIIIFDMKKHPMKHELYDFFNYIKDNYNSTNLLYNMDIYHKLYIAIKNKNNTNDRQLLNTLRLTCLMLNNN